jgi:hypothetical protein
LQFKRRGVIHEPELFQMEKHKNRD